MWKKTRHTKKSWQETKRPSIFCFVLWQHLVKIKFTESETIQRITNRVLALSLASSYSWFLFLLFCLSCEPFPVTWWSEIQHRNMEKELGGSARNALFCLLSTHFFIHHALMKKNPRDTACFCQSQADHVVLKKEKLLPQTEADFAKLTRVSHFSKRAHSLFIHTLTADKMFDFSCAPTKTLIYRRHRQCFYISNNCLLTQPLKIGLWVYTWIHFSAAGPCALPGQH